PDKNSRGYENLISYAKERGWYKDSDGNFDFARVYQAEKSFGLAKNTYRHVKAFEILLEMDLSGLLETDWQPLPFSIRPTRNVSVETLKKILRSHNDENYQHFDKPISICNCDTLESTIAQIRHNPERMILRKALGRPCCSPYVAWYFGINLIPEDYENKTSEISLLEHFRTKPEDMDYKNNAWFRAMELCAAFDILHDERVEAEIKSFEEKIERKLQTLDPQIELRLRNEPGIARAMMDAAVLQWTKDSEDLAKTLRMKMNVITAEALNSVRREKNFDVRIPQNALDFSKVNFSKCFCGPSYAEKNRWSKCVELLDTHDGYMTLSFAPGEWLNDSVHCFMDLYIVMEEESGKKHAATVKAKVQH
ncbi:MAG: C69 family dipeptidase, partial [Synergistaceae bacterium]|nr:C69 family dipeptidase [Synergistaceae bacterium]